jgi:tetratricopeptide (TPR) repeat protein
MKRQEAWSQRLNQIYQENSALPEAFRQSLRGKWVASLNAAQPQEWHVNNEYPHYDVQQLNSRVPEIYFVASNRPERDVQNFEEAHRVNRPQSADELCRAARAFAQLGNHARAQQILKSILPRIPSGLINVPVQMSSTPMSREYTSTYERLFSWAQGFRRAKATAEEVLFYEEALRRERHPIGLNAAAVCYYRLGQRDRAQTYWEEIIRDWSPEKHRETGDWFRHALLGRALLRMDEGKVESAIALYATGSDGLGSISYAGLSYLREIWSPQMEVALRRIAAAAIQRFPAATPEVDEEKKSTGQ